jgi:hypothetical protein
MSVKTGEFGVAACEHLTYANIVHTIIDPGPQQDIAHCEAPCGCYCCYGLHRRTGAISLGVADWPAGNERARGFGVALHCHLTPCEHQPMNRPYAVFSTTLCGNSRDAI